MRPVVVSLSAAGVSNPIPLDINTNPFTVGLGLEISGVNTNTVEYTYDDPFDPAFDPATATWYAHPSLSGKTASTEAQQVYPVRAVRLNCTAFTNGTSKLTVLQAGPL